MRILSSISTFFVDMGTMLYEIFVDGAWYVKTIKSGESRLLNGWV